MFVVILFNDKFLKEGDFSSELFELTPAVFMFDPDLVDPQLSLCQSFSQPHDHGDRSFLVVGLGRRLLELAFSSSGQDAILNLQGFNISNDLSLLTSIH